MNPNGYQCYTQKIERRCVCACVVTPRKEERKNNRLSPNGPIILHPFQMMHVRHLVSPLPPSQQNQLSMISFCPSMDVCTMVSKSYISIHHDISLYILLLSTTLSMICIGNKGWSVSPLLSLWLGPEIETKVNIKTSFSILQTSATHFIIASLIGNHTHLLATFGQSVADLSGTFVIR